MARKKEFEQLECQVVVVCCGTQKNGLTWLQKTGCPFLHLLDPDRVFYRQVGLRRLLKNSFCVKTFKHYADEENASTGTTRVEGLYSGSDWAVMGGDFVVDSSGKLLYAHLCKNQFDRPDIETLVKFCKEQID